ncbi:AMP-binding protein [Leucobacter coleopterorum]|uniref:AMP-binding protein n=1 Tax=Leucobacter coleopterorum TaxID=2714933 RepID=A0ABX6JUL9_9MICO|nr:AMP-binding protein [Leucobacter coleopterorum]QIM17991.1 AMP-binding protein [Leucobacter coleopterorum]
MELSPSGYTDHFARESLPPQASWPNFEFSLPELQYPTKLNAAEELIDEGVRKFGGDNLAIRVPGAETWTYGDLQKRANQVAQVLTEDYGLIPGNRVLLRSPNNAWTVACWLGIIKAGGIVATTMVAWRKREVRNVAKKLLPNVAIIDHRAMSKMSEVFGSTPIAVLGGDDDTLMAACATKSGEFAAVETAADDVALLGATSGTTGEPKVTMHFHRDILANADTFAKHILKLTPEDVTAGTAPLAFTFGLGGLVVFPLRTGGSSVILEKASPMELADLITDFGVTVFYTAPTGYRTALKEGKASELAKLRVAVSAGEHLNKETFEAVRQATGLKLVNGIGSTEMLHVFISAAGDDIRPGATGKAVPGYRATVLDDDGNELPPGQVGRLAVVGPTGCRYLNDERQKNYVVNGWNVTGDAYLMDEDGYFFYQSRTDSMIIAAGYNIGAPEVEEVVETHPEVLECAVIGRPDPARGVIVNAFVVLRDGVAESEEITESIKAHVKENLAIYKCPRRIDFVDELPRNPSGKVQHFVLRDRVAAELATVSTH